MIRPRTRSRASARTRRRLGFTLVELLVVILIIGILVALLVPAIMGAIRTAKDAAVGAEIQTLAQALESFKTKYGDYPPSRIILVENNNYSAGANFATPLSGVSWYEKNITPPPPNIGGAFAANWFAPNNNDLTYGQLLDRSLQYLRKFFPRVAYNTPGIGFDFNGNGVIEPLPILLEGHECLAFFLGGIPIRANPSSGQPGGGGGVLGMGGFGNNPQNPFTQPPSAVTTGVSQNRNAPFYEFQPNRLVDDDGDGIPGYVDSLGDGADARYYAYFSAYGNGGYDPNDVNFAPQDLPDNVYRAYFVNYAAAPSSGTPQNPIMSWAPNPYTSGPPVSGTGALAVFQKPQSFQIISAGRDRLWGPGGQYLTSTAGSSNPQGTAGTQKLPFDSQYIFDGSGNPASSNPNISRNVESDNVTNFTNGRLE